MSQTREQVWSILRELAAETASSRGVEIEDCDRASSLAADLGFSSVDTIHLLISLEDRFGDKLGFDDLVLRGGQYVSDLTLGEMHDFLCGRLGTDAS